MATYTIRNNFHWTEARVKAADNGHINKRQVKRVSKVLCGRSDCRCGGHLSERGPQDVEIYPTGDGSAILAPKAQRGA